MSSIVAVVELYVVFRLAICQSVKQCEDKIGRAAWDLDLYWRHEAYRYGLIRVLHVEKCLGD
jgi:hypothetical protein